MDPGTVGGQDRRQHDEPERDDDHDQGGAHDQARAPSQWPRSRSSGDAGALAGIGADAPGIAPGVARPGIAPGITTVGGGDVVIVVDVGFGGLAGFVVVDFVGLYVC